MPRERRRQQQPLRSEPQITPMKGPFLNMNCPQAGSARKILDTGTPGLPAKFIAFEKWANVTPFVLQDNTQFRPGAPLQSRRWEVQGRPRRGEENGR